MNFPLILTERRKCFIIILERSENIYREIMKRYKTHNFIEVTKQEFQQYQAEPITDAQAYDIQNNLFGVVNLLIQWQRNLDSDSEILKGGKNVA